MGGTNYITTFVAYQMVLNLGAVACSNPNVKGQFIPLAAIPLTIVSPLTKFFCHRNYRQKLNCSRPELFLL